MTEVIAFINELVRLAITFQVEEPVGTFTDTDPTTVILTVQEPDETDSQFTYSADVTRDGVGEYRYDFPVTQAGTHYWTWRGTGTCVATYQGNFFVRPAVV